MVLLPPDAASAEPPAALRQQQLPPNPLPTELEARLRRQRAQQYGRQVREDLAAWHALHIERREAQLAVQRERWEQQRAGRLARLADKQQAERLAQKENQRRQHTPNIGGAQPVAVCKQAGRAAGEGPADSNAQLCHTGLTEQQDCNTAHGSLSAQQHSTQVQGRIDQQGELISAVRPDICTSRQPPAAHSARQGRSPAVVRHTRLAHKLPTTSDHPAPEVFGSNHDAEPPESADQAAVAEVAAAAALPPASDPLEVLLQELLAAEGGGDPFSIINLFVEEQLALQRAQHEDCQQNAHIAVAAAWHAAGREAVDVQAVRILDAASADCRQQEAGGPDPWRETSSAAPAAHRPQQQQPAEVQLLMTDAAQAQLSQVRSAASDGEQMSAGARHRRSSSVVLPSDFDVSGELSALGASVLLSSGPSGLLAALIGRQTLAAADTHAAAAVEQQQEAGSHQPSAAAPAAGLLGLVRKRALQALPGPPAAHGVPASQGQPPAQRAQHTPSPQQPAQQAHQGSSKHVYVQQWLERSAAELASAEVALDTPAGCREDESSACDTQPQLQLDAAAGTEQVALLKANTGAEQVQAGDDDEQEVQEEGYASRAHSSAAAGQWQGRMMGRSALSDLSASGRSSSSESESIPTGFHRPGAPVPPGSSSLQDGSSTPSAVANLAVAGATAGLTPHRGTAAHRHQRQLEQASAPAVAALAADYHRVGLPNTCAGSVCYQEADSRQLSAPANASPSSTASKKMDKEEESALQTALSFGQLQGVAVGADDAAQPNNMPPAVAAGMSDVSSSSWTSSVLSSSLQRQGSSHPVSEGSQACEEEPADLHGPKASLAAQNTTPAASPAVSGMQSLTAHQRHHLQQNHQPAIYLKLSESSAPSSLGSDVQISYGEQQGSPLHLSMQAAWDQGEAGNAAAEAGQHAAAPVHANAYAQEQQDMPAQTSGVDRSVPHSPRLSFQVQMLGQAARPRSPLHAADDRYPGSPPASPGHIQRPLPSASSRPLSPASQGGHSQCMSGDGGSRRPSGDDGGACAAAETTSPGAERSGDFLTRQSQSLASVLSHSSSVSSAASVSGAQAADEDGQVAASSSVHSVGSTHKSAVAVVLPGHQDAGSTASCPVAAAAEFQSPVAGEVDGSPPGTPSVVPASAADESCPGSAHVLDSMVIQTEEHVRSYLGEVMAYFWGERSEAYAAGQVPPLGLEGYLAIERRRPPCGDPQHIFNKLLFDAANEALLSHYSQALDSYAGRMAPRLALLSRERIDQNVVQRVLRWVALGSAAGDLPGAEGRGDTSALLAEDAAEDERTLAQLAGVLQAELAAAEAADAAPQADSAL